jgi:hypothetical protein
LPNEGLNSYREIWTELVGKVLDDLGQPGNTQG